MEIKRLESFKGGWFIGNFEPSVLKTQDFEVAIHHYRANQEWSAHMHKIATEYNVLIDGRMRVCNKELVPGDVFIIEPNEIAAPIYHTNCTILIIKVPSVPGDKYLV